MNFYVNILRKPNFQYTQPRMRIYDLQIMLTSVSLTMLLRSMSPELSSSESKTICKNKNKIGIEVNKYNQL